jgi:NADH dehydrogenase
MPDTILVTGAFSYTGKYVARLLLEGGYRVRTLTSHPHRESGLGDQIEAFPYSFEHPEKLVQSLEGAAALINTYWVRFPRGETTFEGAIRNSRVLIDAAKRAGIGRIVQVSIANPSLESPLAYYRAKAEVERTVIDSGIPHSILRPTVIFGAEDILINNMAWFVRSFPVLVIPGDGKYRVRPIYVEDLAGLLVRAAQRTGNETLNAVGLETLTFEELVRRIGRAMRASPRLVHVPASLAYAATRMLGWWVGDVILTWEEYKGLMDGLLAPGGPATGETQLTEWLEQNGSLLGRKYSSELARHYRISALSIGGDKDATGKGVWGTQG